jgi:hypothetical protein
MIKKVRRMGLGLGLAALLPMLGGCYGSFGLVRKVYKFNTEVSQDKWAREGVFLLFNIPFFSVYGLSAFLDAIFFNAVEFWTGEQLIASSSSTPNRSSDSPVVDTTVDTSQQPARRPSSPTTPKQRPTKKKSQ